MNEDEVDIDQCSKERSSESLEHREKLRLTPQNGHHISTNSDLQHSPSSDNDARPVTQVMKKKGSKDERMRMRSKCNCDELRYVECTLETKDLWDKFHDLETEMIITKTGRYVIILLHSS